MEYTPPKSAVVEGAGVEIGNQLANLLAIPGNLSPPPSERERPLLVAVSDTNNGKRERWRERLASLITVMKNDDRPGASYC